MYLKKHLKNQLSVFSKILLTLNVFAVILLILSYLASWIPADKVWQLAFLGLAYPIFFILNILFIFLWIIIGKKKLILLSFISLLIGWKHIRSFIQFHSLKEINKSEQTLKVMSYNVRLFDLYNWTNSQNITTRNKIFELIRKESPDIICLQEFYSDDSRKFDVLDTLIKLQKAKYYHVDYFKSRWRVQHWGVATMSSYPIINKQRVQFINSENNYLIYTDILFKKDTIRIFNIHYESIRLGKEDLLFVSDLTNNRTENKDLTDKTKKIYWKLKSAFIKRAEQVRIAMYYINKSPYPVIICGDFNDTPSSYAYNQMTSKLCDAFVESGNGMGKTYAGNIPSFRIDYILHDNNFKAYNFKTIKEDLSDHYPVDCYLVLKNK